MYAKTIALVLATALLGAAAPTASPELTARTCTSANPSVIDVLDAAYPNAGSTGVTFSLARTGGPGTNTKKTAILFKDIPAGATGCMLKVEWPANLDMGEGSNTANVFTTEDFAGWTPSWNNPPRTLAQVSSTNFPTDYNSPAYWTYLYSSTCSPNMGFLFELADWQQGPGNINFIHKGQGYKHSGAGFTLVYNC